MRPIDADALIKAIGKLSFKDMSGEEMAMVFHIHDMISEAPTLDYAPVRRGEWIHDINNLYACSECLMRQTQRMRGRLMNFCPNCGANMMPLPEPPKEE